MCLGVSPLNPPPPPPAARLELHKSPFFHPNLIGHSSKQTLGGEWQFIGTAKLGGGGWEKGGRGQSGSAYSDHTQLGAAVTAQPHSYGHCRGGRSGMEVPEPLSLPLFQSSLGTGPLQRHRDGRALCGRGRGGGEKLARGPSPPSANPTHGGPQQTAGTAERADDPAEPSTAETLHNSSQRCVPARLRPR